MGTALTTERRAGGGIRHDEPAGPAGRVTLRAVLMGLLLCLVIGVGAPVATFLLQGSYMDLDFSTPAAVFLLFVLVAGLNPLLALLRRRWVFTPTELIVVYTMMIVACALSTMGMAAQLVPTLAAAHYYGKDLDAWKNHVLPYLKPWLIPDAHASDGLFEGLRPGEAIPWSAWFTPLAWWAILLLAFYAASICLMAMLRRRWVDEERLAYPLTQLPIELARPQTAAGGGPLLRNAVMWAGFGTAFFFGCVRGLHHYFPSFPGFAAVWYFPVFRDSTTLAVRISFPMIGFFFLANAEAVFSLWFFNRIAWLAQAWMNVTGAQYRAELGPYSAAPLFGHLALGAFLGVAITTLRLAWPHLLAVARQACSRSAKHPDRSLRDDGEPLSYRAAFWGFAAGVAVMWAWLLHAGMDPFAVPLFLLGLFALLLTLTRVVIESGMAEAAVPTVPAGFLHALLGNRMLPAPAMAAQGMTYIWSGDVRTVVMTSAAHGFRLGDIASGSRRGITMTMFAAVVVTSVSAIATTLYLAYTRGGAGLNPWYFVDGPQLPYKWIAERNANPVGANVGAYSMIAAGGLCAAFLAVMRQRCVWWPFHPIGFAIAPTWIVNEIWLSAFIAWLARSLVTRYGSLGFYRRARPYFMGLILGQFTCNGFWLILDALTGARGNQVFWI